MVTQTLEANHASGLGSSIVLKLFDPADIDTIVATSAVGSEYTNNKARSAFVFTDVPAGRYIVNGFIGVHGGVVNDSVTLTLTTATFRLDSELIAEDLLVPTGEPGQGAPPVSATLREKMSWIYKAWRNQKTQTGALISLFADDAATVDQKATLADDGTTATIGEMESGP